LDNPRLFHTPHSLDHGWGRQPHLLAKFRVGDAGVFLERVEYLPPDFVQQLLFIQRYSARKLSNLYCDRSNNFVLLFSQGRWHCSIQRVMKETYESSEEITDLVRAFETCTLDRG